MAEVKIQQNPLVIASISIENKGDKNLMSSIKWELYMVCKV